MNKEKWNEYIYKMQDATEAKLCSDANVPNILEKLLPSSKTHPSLIDIGCGNLGLIDWAESKGYKCIGFDLRLPKKKTDRTILLGDMHDLKDIGIEKFDIVTCSNVFEHSIAPMVAMSEMKGILKKNGKLLIIIPDYVDRWIFDRCHIMLLTNKQMENLSSKCNLFLDKYLEMGEGNKKMRAFLYGREEDAL